jgi:hypothetical protein
LEYGGVINMRIPTIPLITMANVMIIKVRVAWRGLHAHFGWAFRECKLRFDDGLKVRASMRKCSARFDYRIENYLALWPPIWEILKSGWIKLTLLLL